MAYDMSARLDSLGNRMKDLHSNALTYRRANKHGITQSQIIENFTPEKIDVTQLLAIGIPIVVEKAQDFVFDTTELADFDTDLPKTGDQIIWGEAQYEVAVIGDETYTFTTSSRKRIRVHTKQVR